MRQKAAEGTDEASSQAAAGAALLRLRGVHRPGAADDEVLVRHSGRCGRHALRCPRRYPPACALHVYPRRAGWALRHARKLLHGMLGSSGEAHTAARPVGCAAPLAPPAQSAGWHCGRWVQGASFHCATACQQSLHRPLCRLATCRELIAISMGSDVQSNFRCARGGQAGACCAGLREAQREGLLSWASRI